MVFSRTTFILAPNCKRNWVYQRTTVQQDLELLKAPSNSLDFVHPCFHWRGTICFCLKDE